MGQPSIYHRGSVVKCSVLIGAAQLQTGQSLQQGLDHADRALYQAKSQGRNRVKDASRVSRRADGKLDLSVTIEP